jgi:CheY-like chemotaxis protein
MWKGKRVDENLVLVVDDDRDVRESLSNLLTAEGYSVLEVDNGQKALELLECGSHLPRVILLDLAMPVIDGRQFLELPRRGANAASYTGGRGFRQLAIRRTTRWNRSLSAQARGRRSPD